MKILTIKPNYWAYRIEHIRWLTLIHVSIKYLNNIVESDHRFVKRITRPMMGFKAFHSAHATLMGVELHHMLRKHQHACSSNQTVFEQFYALAAWFRLGKNQFSLVKKMRQNHPIRYMFFFSSKLGGEGSSFVSATLLNWMGKPERQASSKPLYSLTRVS